MSGQKNKKTAFIKAQIKLSLKVNSAAMNPTRSIIERSFSINLRIMKACCLYPPKSHTLFYKIRAYLMHFLLVVPVPTLGILYLLLEEDLNMERVSYNAGFLAQTAGFITKLLPFVRDGDRMRRCIDYFDSSFFTLDNDHQEKLMERCIKVCKRNTLIFLVCVSGGVTSWATKPLFWEGRALPVDVWLPFNIYGDFRVYISVYLFLAIGAYYAAFSTGVVDPLIAGLAYHATTQIQILKDNLQHLSEYSEQEMKKKSGLDRKNRIMYKKIKHAIEHHNAILKFVKEYEQCFSLSVFSQFASSVFVICFCCLQLSKIESLNYNFFQLVMYFSVILAQIYFYCYYGSTLFEESNTITNAVCMGRIYDYDTKSKKALTILMERAKKPITVTSGKILDLSLETFTTILRRSYSLLAVLKNYQ